MPRRSTTRRRCWRCTAGSVQQLYNGDTFVGWGEQPYFSEYNSKGQLLFDARFADSNMSYRTYRFDWNGYPKTRPAVAASNSGKTTTVYVSWNGATGVKRWRVLAGASSKLAEGRDHGAPHRIRDGDQDLPPEPRAGPGPRWLGSRARHLGGHGIALRATPERQR